MRASFVFATCLTVSASAWAQASPPQPPGALAPHEARVAWVRGRVTVALGSNPARALAADEVLPAGARLHVEPEGHVELRLANGAGLALESGARLILFSSPTPQPPGTPGAGTTTLQHGTVRVTSSPEPGAATIPLATTAVTVHLGRGDGTVAAELGGHLTRIAAQRGRFRVWTPTREYILRAGNGIVEEAGRPRQPFRQLPPSPVWTSPPPERVMSTGEPVDVGAAWALRGARVASQWRVELARDEAFRELVSVERSPAEVTRWRARGLGPGRYFARVVALDPERFEGLPSPVARVVVAAPTLVPGRLAADAPGSLARVEVPEGFFCGLDGAAMAATDAPLRLVPGRPHVLRCASRPDGDDVRELTVPAAQAGPLVHELEVHGTALGEGVLGLRLRDAEGRPVPYADVSVTADRGVTIDTVREARERGVYNATVRWPSGVSSATFRVTVNGAERFEETLSQNR